MSFLELKNISKEYHRGEMKALDDISLHIDKSEFVCFLGPSGCGKTTLLNIISGLISPTQGEILLEKKNITHQTPALRKFGVVFQDYALFPNLTVEKNITYGLSRKQLTSKELEKRVDELLVLVGLSNRARSYPHELSGGQQQRVALARALAPSPKLLLLDEPFSALDAQVRERLRSDLKRLHEMLGLTVIMVTHDQEEAMALSDRIVVMNNGRIIQEGTPECLYLFPKTKFVANFIGLTNVIKLPEWDSVEKYYRYEMLEVMPVNEQNIARDKALVFRVLSSQIMGAYYRLRLLHSDQKTIIYADVSHKKYALLNLKVEKLVVVIPNK